ncbi:MAG: MCE family protein [Alphaproteobacteria bacterium]|nr:MAG: MCE family protein [Alphaproteobacteria bacterium]
METRANYLMVGTFVLVFAAGLVAFVLWLAKFQFDVRFDRYDIRYEGSVTGLKVGSPVRYKGVRVGEVIDVRLDPEEPEVVWITIEVEAQTPVRSDTVATLELEGLTGGLYVLLSETTAASPPLRPSPERPYPIIASRPSTLQQVLQGAPELVQKINLLVARANDLLSDDNRAQFAATLVNLRAFTGTLAERRDDIGALFQDAGATMGNLRAASDALEDLAVSLKADSARLVERLEATLAAFEAMATGIDLTVTDTAAEARGLIAELRKTARNFSAMSRELEQMITENREPIRDFTAVGLSELTVLLIQMKDLVTTLNRITTEIERDPARFFFGNRQQGYEAR